MSSAKELLQRLIIYRSVTPQDNGCQEYIADFLADLGFIVERFADGQVSNLWAKFGENRPLFVFTGHTDVIPVGALGDWRYPPFSAFEADGYIWGRGAADMKGGLAAVLTAVKGFLSLGSFDGSIGIMLTSGEELLDPCDGTKRIVERLSAKGEMIDYCLLCEPSSINTLGDAIKVGRRGSLSGKLKVIGKGGHIAYPHLLSNPIHTIAPLLLALTEEQWDQGNAHFPPTSFQVSKVNAGADAGNIVPHNLEMNFNFRYSPAVTPEELIRRVETLSRKYAQNELTLDWFHEATPFLTEDGRLLSSTRQVISNQLGIDAKLDTSGGISDARFLAPVCKEVIELGPLHDTIHQPNERVSIADIETLVEIYTGILKLIFAG